MLVEGQVQSSICSVDTVGPLPVVDTELEEEVEPVEVLVNTDVEEEEETVDIWELVVEVELDAIEDAVELDVVALLVDVVSNA